MYRSKVVIPQSSKCAFDMDLTSSNSNVDRMHIECVCRGCFHRLWTQSVVSRPLKDAFSQSLPVVVAHALKRLVETE